jgi:glycosyltransferase involved in cell wall biosynthesis
MRFSILLPTRNGGDFLENCIRSILEQDHDDFELVISDNANTDATPDIINEFKSDSRLKVIYQDTPISVSENWTAALQASSGEYVLMMGDDDYLLQSALRRLDEVLARHDEPECVLYNGYSYVTPKAISDNPASFWTREHFNFGLDFGKESVLDLSHRMDIVYDMFRYQTRIPLNMQTTLFSRHAIEKECGGVFRAPFPDHYLLNALLITADKWVYLPEQLVVVGVSPKSFGHYFYSQKADAGLEYLGIDTYFPGALPGSPLLNGMTVWLHDLKVQYPEQLKGIEIDWRGYVRRQVYAWLQQRRYGGISTDELISYFTSLSIRNWLRLLTTVVDGESWSRLSDLLQFGKKSQSETLWQGLIPLPDIVNIREFVEWLGLQKEKDK